MSIKVLAVKGVETLDLDKFRNLSEFIGYLTKMKRSIDEDGDLLNKYQALLSSVRPITVKVKVKARSPSAKVLAVKSREDVITFDDAAPPKVEKPHVLLKQPAFKALVPHQALVNRLSERLDDIERMIAELDYLFVEDKLHDKAVAALNALKADVLKKLNEASKVMDKFSRKEEPKAFTTLADKVFAAIQKALGPNTKAITEKRINDFSETSIFFYRYIKLTDFVLDSGFPIPLYIILVCKVDPLANITYSVKVYPALVAPKNVDTSPKTTHTFTTAREAMETLDDLIQAENNYASMIADHPVILTKDQINIKKIPVKDSIESYEFTDDGIWFLLNKGVLDKDGSIEAQIIQYVKGAASKYKAGLIRHKKVKQDGRVAIKLVFAPNMKDSVNKAKMTRTQVHMLKEGLGMSDDMVKRLNALI